jgi:hypothetical protein
LLSFPGATEMFHFAPFASTPYNPPEGGASAVDDPACTESGCPIRRPRDLSLLGGSPEIIAAFHVLHRLLAPRHPPCTLGSWHSIFHLSAPPAAFAADASPIHMSKSARLASRAPSGRPGSIRPRGPSCSPSRRGATHLATVKARLARGPGGDDRDRTGNLRLAKPALSPLSYIPAGVTALRAGRSLSGGPKWARTTDLALIRGAL